MLLSPIFRSSFVSALILSGSSIVLAEAPAPTAPITLAQTQLLEIMTNITFEICWETANVRAQLVENQDKAVEELVQNFDMAVAGKPAVQGEPNLNLKNAASICGLDATSKRNSYNAHATREKVRTNIFDRFFKARSDSKATLQAPLEILFFSDWAFKDLSGWASDVLLHELMLTPDQDKMAKKVFSDTQKFRESEYNLEYRSQIFDTFSLSDYSKDEFIEHARLIPKKN